MRKLLAPERRGFARSAANQRRIVEAIVFANGAAAHLNFQDRLLMEINCRTAGDPIVSFDQQNMLPLM